MEAAGITPLTWTSTTDTATFRANMIESLKDNEYAAAFQVKALPDLYGSSSARWSCLSVPSLNSTPVKKTRRAGARSRRITQLANGRPRGPSLVQKGDPQ
jgi:hypothetical protein